MSELYWGYNYNLKSAWLVEWQIKHCGVSLKEVSNAETDPF